jgi:hypothetical protein
MVVAVRRAHSILLVHSILGNMGVNGELPMRARRKTYADRIKYPATP